MLFTVEGRCLNIEIREGERLLHQIRRLPNPISVSIIKVEIQRLQLDTNLDGGKKGNRNIHWACCQDEDRPCRSYLDVRDIGNVVPALRRILTQPGIRDPIHPYLPYPPSMWGLSLSHELNKSYNRKESTYVLPPEHLPRCRQ